MVNPRPWAAVGNFDGVHRGHQHLLAETIRAAGEAGAKAGVVVFEPHPRRYFRPEDPPFLITTPETRRRLLEEAGAAFVVELPFDAALVATSPEDFVAEVLRRRLGLGGV
ncbi:MAG: hypothetical protein K2Q06_10380, partial [Parvularculaceae bacterium]|nr:hypothetical protein [Parvularculaceae bacterium]